MTQETATPTDKAKKKKRRLPRILAVLLLIFLITALTGIGLYKKTPQGKFLASIIYFSTQTLNSRDYIAYDIDIMEMCRSYFNSDLSFEGQLYMNDIANFGFSTNMDVEGKRSFSQKKIIGSADMDVLFFNIGQFDFYTEENTIYTVVPMLDDLSYAFEMDSDLFNKAPDFTSDISSEWFQAHKMDFWNFVHSIEIIETGESLTDGNITSTEYRITIPAGSGAFIFELLGKEVPDYDAVFDIYLTPSGHFRRLEVDLDHLMPDTTMVIDGTDAGTFIMTKNLPDGERMTTTIDKDGSYTYTNYARFTVVYETYADYTIETSGYTTWQHTDTGIAIDINDISVVKDGQLQLTANYSGTLDTVAFKEDLFADVKTNLDAIEHIGWKELRDDSQAFVDEVMTKAKNVVYQQE